MMLHESSDHPQKSLQIKHNDKFFSKLLTRETSGANYSSRIYYAGLPGAVPFLWESQPGTPIHRLSDDRTPPLTPPPSYFSDSLHKPPKTRSRSLSLFHVFFNSRRKPDLFTPPFSKSASLPSSGRRFLKPEEEATPTGSVLCFGIGR